MVRVHSIAAWVTIFRTQAAKKHAGVECQQL